MWKALRRTTLIFPPVRKLRNQLHQNATQIAQLSRELGEMREQRNAAVEKLHRQSPQTGGDAGLAAQRTRERDEAIRRNEELTAAVKKLEAKCMSLERDYFASVEAKSALLRLTKDALPSR